MERSGSVLGRLVSLSLLRHDMDERRSRQALHVFHRREKNVHVVAVEWAHVLESHFFEENPRSDHSLDAFLHRLRHPDHGEAQAGNRLEEVLRLFPDGRVEGSGHEAGEVGREGADIGRDRHLVVVQDDDQVLLQVAGVVERLERHPRRHRPVSDHGDDPPRFFLQVPGAGESEGRGNRRGRVPRPEHVERGLVAAEKPGDPPIGGSSRRPPGAP